MKRKVILPVILALLITMMSSVPKASAATPAEIETAIDDGVAWLAANQQGDGTWPEDLSNWIEDVALTGLAVLKLEHRAYELGYTSPFDLAYPYYLNVENAWNYLFTKLLTIDIGTQDHTAGATGTVDDPDVRPNGIGVYARGHTYPFDVYDTGIVLSAIVASGTPGRSTGMDFDGDTITDSFFDVAQDMVDWLAWAQADSNDPRHGSVAGEGGWSYGAMDNTGYGTSSYGPDNSNSGYAVLGLGYAIDFGCTVPSWVLTELNAYIEDIQDPVDGDPYDYDGGSWYHLVGSGIKPNILKTGNLIFEMALVGDTPTTPRVEDALNYLASNWGKASGLNWPPGWDGDPANYQAMFTTMKGLEIMGVDTLPGGIDWYEDFTDRIVDQQSGDGSWQASAERGNPSIITAWALLTLEKVSPPPITGMPLFSDMLTILSVGLVAGSVVIRRRRKTNS